MINILGLAIGLASCLFIFLYVRNELSYDAWHAKADRIVRYTTVLHSPESDVSLAVSPVILGSALLKDDPAIEATVRIEGGQIAVRRENEVFSPDGFFFSEPSLFYIFSYQFLAGDPKTCLASPHSIVLTATTARTYFGKAEAVGRTLTCNSEKYRVTAVIADLPPNSDIKINALLSKDFSKATSWTSDDFESYTFALCRQKPDLAHLRRALATIVARYVQPELDQQAVKEYKFGFEVEPLSEVHFSKGKLVDMPKGDRQFNRIFSALAAFILVIALLNYINLATARATERMKEVGVRKVIGARPFQLIGQFLGESFFLVGIAWLLAVGLVEAGLPLLNRVFLIDLGFSWQQALLFSALLIPVTSVMAGLYPAFVLSGFRPVTSLKGGNATRSQGARLRRVLTALQFVIALAMLTCAFVAYSQMHFIAHHDTGVDRSRMICIPLPRDSVSQSAANVFIQAVRKESGVDGVTVGSGLPAEGVMLSSTTTWSNGRKKDMMCNYFFIDPQLIPMMHIRLAAGRNFTDSLPTDKTEGFIVNEAFVRAAGWKSGVGQRVEGGIGRKGVVIGVTRDFFFKSVHNVIEPMLMVYRPDPAMAVLVKASPSILARLKVLWRQDFPAQPFDSFFPDDNYNEQYKKDRLTLSLFNALTGLAIFISCLGLYGLVSLITLQRTREIGIRKVLGASLSGLVTLLAREQLWLIAVAAFIGLPLALFFSHRWLATYAYHANLSPWMFLLPVLTLLLLSIAVTGWRIFRAARANPVDSLRAE